MIIWGPEKPAGGSPAVDISAAAEIPWDRLNPAYQHGQIPVPGLHGMFTESVTGAMEGLKLIGKEGLPGKINPGYFTGPGRIRELGDKEWLLGWSFEGRRLSLPDARRSIFIPAYLWAAQNKAYAVLARLRQFGKVCEKKGKDLIVFDGIPSDDPDDFEKPLSAAAVLVSYLHDRQENLTRAPTLQ